MASSNDCNFSATMDEFLSLICDYKVKSFTAVLQLKETHHYEADKIMNQELEREFNIYGCVGKDHKKTVT
eukprot:13260915-Ditylum_brightwellii.AAC.1